MARTKQELEELLDGKYSQFNYDAESDELFRLARRQIERKRSAGVSDTLAKYAANTSMAGSSEAMAAAQQTASSYDRALSEALLERESAAYKRWSDERSALERELESLPKVGKNGMSEDVYNASIKRLENDIKTYTSRKNSKRVDELVEQKRLLDGAYYGFISDEYKTQKSTLTQYNVDEILSNLSETRLSDGSVVMYVDANTYRQLASYYHENPYVSENGTGYFGEDALRVLGIVPMGG